MLKVLICCIKISILCTMYHVEILILFFFLRLVMRPTFSWFWCWTLYVCDLIFDSVNDLRTSEETVWRLTDMAYIMKTKYFHEFISLIMFKNWNYDEKNLMLRTRTWMLGTWSWSRTIRIWTWSYTWKGSTGLQHWYQDFVLCIFHINVCF